MLLAWSRILSAWAVTCFARFAAAMAARSCFDRLKSFSVAGQALAADALEKCNARAR